MSSSTMVGTKGSGLTKDERFVILASSTGTIFEWYDFYLYATLAPFFAALFFPPGNDTWALLGALGAYAAGFLVRPFGALFFGRLGDIVGRKYTFLVTIVLMGISTFLVGCLPTYASIGGLAPILLLLIRLTQGLAIGGEYGGAATYVAEHSANGHRGYTTSWIQTTATLGFFLSLLVIGVLRWNVDPTTFKEWVWRVPFWASIFLLAFSVWIRLKLNESPVFQKMKAEGKGSATPIRDSFFKFPNNKIALLALLGATMGQAVTWYTAQFYALFFINGPLKADWWVGYTILGFAVLLSTPLFVVFGRLSDRIGRLPLIVGGCALGALCIIPAFHMLSSAVNPELDAFNAANQSKIIVSADPANCHFTVFPVAGWTTQGDCDKGKSILTANGIAFTSVDGAAGSKATLMIGDAKVEGVSPFGWQKALAEAGYPHFKLAAADVNLTKDQTDVLVKAQADKAAITAKDAAATKAASDTIEKVVNEARKAGDAAAKPLGAVNSIAAPVVGADGASVVKASQVTGTTAKALSTGRYVEAILICLFLMAIACMVYGPIAAYLVELFPSNIRYTSMSLPYHIGNGWVGGLLPLTATAYVAYNGGVFAGLWYPVIFAGVCAVIGILFLTDTKNVDISKT